MINDILRLWGHISSRNRHKCLFLVAITLITSITELFSLGMILPLINVLIDPELLYRSETIKSVFISYGYDDPSELVFPIVLTFMFAVLFSGAARLVLLILQTKAAYAIGADLSVKIFSSTINLNYENFIQRNSSEFISGVMVKTNTIVNSIVLPILTILSSSVLILFIVGFLVAVDSKIAGLTFGILGSLYLMIVMGTRAALSKYGTTVANESNRVVKLLQEGFGNFRDIVMDGNQRVFTDIFKRTDLALRTAQADAQILSGSPRYIIEALAMVFIAWLAFYMSESIDSGLVSALPLLGALAVGAQRLLPMFQQVYLSISAIRGGHKSMLDVFELLNEDEPRSIFNDHESVDLIPLESIRFENVSYQYPNTDIWILKDVSWAIPKGMWVGIVGKSGAGKSTLLDLLMGLLIPTEGRLIVDGLPVENHGLNRWRSAITHVPQHIFLSDATISENIAFGVDAGLIDMERVEEAAKLAEIHTYIKSMPLGFKTIVGERGLRLSGGQRQRIGIARAMYRKAEVVILDEATSALDVDTEKKVMSNIQSSFREKTIIVVTHRASTLAYCDVTVEVIGRELAFK